MFFLAAVAFLLQTTSTALATVSTTAGVLLELISVLIFYLYSDTTKQLAEVRHRLEQTQRFLLAYSIARSIEEGPIKQAAYAQLVLRMAPQGPPPPPDTL
jgi:hypothetical protein